VGNVFIPGIDSYTSNRAVLLDGSDLNGLIRGTNLFVDDNLFPGADTDPWSVVTNRSQFSRAEIEVSSPPTWPDTFVAIPADKALERVLETAGARPANRNDVDARIVKNVLDGTGTIINCVAPNGTDRCKKNGGGWPVLPEIVRAISLPENPNSDDDGDGYTNLEEFLHDMAAYVESADTPPKAPAEFGVQ
jgi:hypothetical protein